MDMILADINSPTSAVRARIEWALAGPSGYPASAWRTVKGMTGLMPSEAATIVQELREGVAAAVLYKVVTYNIR